MFPTLLFNLQYIPLMPTQLQDCPRVRVIKFGRLFVITTYVRVQDPLVNATAFHWKESQ